MFGAVYPDAPVEVILTDAEVDPLLASMVIVIWYVTIEKIEIVLADAGSTEEGKFGGSSENGIVYKSSQT